MNIMLLDLIGIITNVFLLLISRSIPSDFLLPLDLIVNNILATFGIWVYISYNILLIWEMKSFIYNVFQLFNTYAGDKAVNLITMKNNKE